MIRVKNILKGLHSDFQEKMDLSYLKNFETLRIFLKKQAHEKVLFCIVKKWRYLFTFS